MSGRRRTARISLAIATVAALGVVSPANAVLPVTSTVLMNQPGYDFTGPRIGGRYIVAERRFGTSDVVVYDRGTDDDTSIGYGDGKDQGQPAISGSRIVWIDKTEADGEIWYDDLADSALAKRVTTDTDDDVAVSIDGNHIVWKNGIIPGRHIRWYDIERNTFGTVPDTNLPNGISVDQGRICWFDTDKRAGFDGIYLYDIDTATSDVLQESSRAATIIDPASTSLHGDRAAWVQTAITTPTDLNIYTRDTRTRQYVIPTGNVWAQTHPSIFGDLTAWQDARNTTKDIYGQWAPEQPDIQIVAASEYDDMYPDVYGHSIVSQRDVGEDRVALSVAPLSPHRLSGADRYTTSAEIALETFGASRNAVIATGEGFPDALCASALAGTLDGPLLLTRKAALPAPTLSVLQDLGVENVWIVGGTGAISAVVDAQLAAAGMTVMPRVSGIDRYDTARQVAYLVMDIVNARPPEADQWRRAAFFVNGSRFPDALSVAAHAYSEQIPILLVRPDSVPDPTRDAITFCAIDHAYLIGGTAVISAANAMTIDSLVGPIERWAGADRYATTAICATKGVGYGWLDYDNLGVATGYNFPDALSGGAASGYVGSPLILTRPTTIDPSTYDFLDQRRYDFGGMTVFGGTGAIGDGVLTDFTVYLN
ncbi:MAG: cell wall-binding repeat-containing protein [Coriobacteriia bacterium]|nr:cell wall-binding repeat-containing protein [Coriobacteriia bacterium]